LKAAYPSVVIQLFGLQYLRDRHIAHDDQFIFKPLSVDHIAVHHRRLYESYIKFSLFEILDDLGTDIDTEIHIIVDGIAHRVEALTGNNISSDGV
jgi:hypothetical protein